MKIKLESIQDEIDFDLLQEIKKEPGLNALDLGRRVYRSRYCVFDRTKKLEQEQYITRILSSNKTYLMYPSQNLTLEDIGEARVAFGKNMLERLKDDHSLTDVKRYAAILKPMTLCAPKSFKTLVALAEQEEATCQELTDIIVPKVESQTIHNQLKHLIEKGLVTIVNRNERPFVYFLAPPLTYDLLQECLEEIAQEMETNVITTERTSEQLTSSIDNEKPISMTKEKELSIYDPSQVDYPSIEFLTKEEAYLFLDVIEQQKEELAKLREEVNLLTERLEAVEKKQENANTIKPAQDLIMIRRLRALSNHHG